ncbi:MAG TPA: FAD-dependent oxidoreductase, partial [Spirochaetota bacterium]|nr:FAD-dependent oxidoreductase [Spirochaetota bacterium]
LDPETLYFLFKYKAESYERLHELIRKGTKGVTVFEMQPRAGKGVGKSTKWILMGNIEDHDVKIVTGAKVTSVRNNMIVYEKEGEIHSEKFDSIINAAGARSVRNTADKLESTGIPFTVIGDSVRPMNILQAVHEGFLAVMNLK